MQNVNSATSESSLIHTGSTTTMSSLRANLINVQIALDEANNELNRLRLENATLKAAALPDRGPKKNKRMVVSTPVDYSQDLLAVANKFTLLDFVWVKMSAFQQSCPPNPIPIETRYSNEINTLLHIRYRLYECVPEKYHTYLRDLSEFATNFGRSAQQQRSNIMAKLHSAVQIIFAKTYPEITLHLLSNPKDRETSEVCRQLYMNGNLPRDEKFEPLLAPIIYAGGIVTVDGIFQNEVLFLIGTCSLFGYTALIKGKVPKNSQGFKWGIKSATSGLISFCCIAAIFLVSNDVTFKEVGSKSGINYGSAFLAYKQRLEMHEKTPRFQRIINVWNTQLFGISAGADAEEFNFDSVDARSAAIDAALSGDIHDVEPESEVISGPSFMPIPDRTPSITSLGSSRLSAGAPLSSASGIHREVVPPPTSPTTVISSHTAGTLASRSNSVVFTLPASNPGSVLSLANDQDDFSDSEGTKPESETLQPRSSLPAVSIIQIIESNITHSESTQPSMVPAASLTTLTSEPPITLNSDVTVSPVTPVESASTPGDDNQVLVNNAPTRVATKRGRPKKTTQAKDQAVTRRSTRNQRG